jgi:hypothetical protein
MKRRYLFLLGAAGVALGCGRQAKISGGRVDGFSPGAATSAIFNLSVTQDDIGGDPGLPDTISTLIVVASDRPGLCDELAAGAPEDATLVAIQAQKFNFDGGPDAFASGEALANTPGGIADGSQLVGAVFLVVEGGAPKVSATGGGAGEITLGRFADTLSLSGTDELAFQLDFEQDEIVPLDEPVPLGFTITDATLCETLEF